MHISAIWRFKFTDRKETQSLGKKTTVDKSAWINAW